MSTSIKDIYELFYLKVESETLALQDPVIARRSLYLYLLNSITRFSTCKKELDIVGNKFIEDVISKGESQLVLTDIDKKPYLHIYSEDNEEIPYKVKFSEEEKTLTITLEREQFNNIYVDGFIDGFITEDLTNLEKNILATGMALEWIVPQVNREDNLRQRVTNKEFKKLSNANQLDKLIKLKRTSEEEYGIMIKDYTYRGFNGYS